MLRAEMRRGVSDADRFASRGGDEDESMKRLCQHRAGDFEQIRRRSGDVVLLQLRAQQSDNRLKVLRVGGPDGDGRIHGWAGGGAGMGSY